ncbi:MmyB family transcriptional regulator [Streptomyces sp. NPDC002156]
MVSRTGDVFAADPGGLRPRAGTEGRPARQCNVARRFFCLPRVARSLFADPDSQLRGCTARLRAPVGNAPPRRPDPTTLVGERVVTVRSCWRFARVVLAGHGTSVRRRARHPPAASAASQRSRSPG